jgi:hypothetical protein
MVIERGNNTAFIVDEVPPDELPATHRYAAAFERQIETKARTLDSQDLFSILGVKRDSTSAEIDAAFEMLSGWFSLERMHELGLGHLLAPLTRIREHLRQAHALLSDDELRASYLRSSEDATPVEQHQPVRSAA